MNGQAIYELFLDGAYHDTGKDGGKLYHPSFRKGYRSISSGNVGLASAERKLRAAGRLQGSCVGDVYRQQATVAE